MTQPAITDQLTTATATALRDCLRDNAARTSLGPVVSAILRHAATGGVMDGCDCTGEVIIGGMPVAASGRAVVRVTQVAPADLLGRGQARAGGVRAQRCGSAWVVTYELAIVRCYPVTEDGSPLTPDQAEEIAIKLANDREALRTTINCCPYLDRHSGTELVSMNALGPAGGCAGWNATIRVLQARG